jgi:cyclic pyranopterin phosphate synthase
MGLREKTVTDSLRRPIRGLRISVTDRCNFRCSYCMPKEVFNPQYRFLARSELLSFEEITRIAGIFAGLGVRKLRLTGGEPLVRRNIEVLVAELAGIEGIEDISLTTNGSLLTRDMARRLKAAGLNRLNVSLDALDDATFKAINHVDFPVARVLEAVDHAAAEGLAPVKVNMVVKAGVNEHSILPMARRFHGSGHILRFIEYMDVGHSNGWRMGDMVPGADIVAHIAQEMPIEPADPNYRGEVAKRWRYRDGGGEIGVITSVTQPFCSACARARLSAKGSLYTCLFATHGHDLRDLLRGGATDAQVKETIVAIWGRRGDRYSELRTEATVSLPKVEMSFIGG